MSSRTSALRWMVSACAAGVPVVLLLAGPAAAVGAPRVPRPGTVNPYSPASGHPYRHGVLPTIGRQRLMQKWAAAHRVRAASAINLSYGGGLSGHGVTTGHEKVYLVFFGSQWGRKGTDSHGNITLTGDPSREAPYLQQLFKGLGTGGERWSGVMTQYCDGVAYNSQVCPAHSSHVAYPTGGALAGVWVDERAASPDIATGLQLGAEAIAAAAHFGNHTAASNLRAQYVILSATNTHPDGFNLPGSGFCAWHDDSGDPNLPGGPVNSPLDVAFTNMPYVTDAGMSCGVNFVNGGSQGLLDGASIVEGHEYAETITDQYPPFGWTDIPGAENGDLCAWNPPGSIGGTNDLKLPGGTFAMQSTWSNDANHGVGACRFSHPLITNG